MGADRLSRARLVDRSVGPAVPAAARPDSGTGRAGAGARAQPATRLRVGTRSVHRYRQRIGLAHRDRRRRFTCIRTLPAERLVGARHPGLGIPAAGPVSVEELRDDDLALDRDARGAGAVSGGVDAPGVGSAAAGVSGLARTTRVRRLRHPAGGADRNRHDARGTARPPPPSRAQATAMRTGPWHRWSHTTP